ncbi:MAG TPA: surface-adhesin E family protein [Nitrospiraceae bacterium]|nr:surface-adhesin E family protein [Nitrospiraceae bacterium]
MSLSLRPHHRFPLPCVVTYHAGPFHPLLLAYFSGFWSLITLLFLSTVPAYAEWVAVEKAYLSPGIQTVYVDPDSIRREGNLVTLWQLIDFKTMQGNAGMGPFGFGPHRFLSTKTHKQFDCAGKRLRLLEFTEFSRRMGTGIAANGYVDNGNWLQVEPESINHALWEVACGKE